MGEVIKQRQVWHSFFISNFAQTIRFTANHYSVSLPSIETLLFNRCRKTKLWCWYQLAWNGETDNWKDFRARSHVHVKDFTGVVTCQVWWLNTSYANCQWIRTPKLGEGRRCVSGQDSKCGVLCLTNFATCFQWPHLKPWRRFLAPELAMASSPRLRSGRRSKSSCRWGMPFSRLWCCGKSTWFGNSLLKTVKWRRQTLAREKRRGMRNSSSQQCLKTCFWKRARVPTTKLRPVRMAWSDSNRSERDLGLEQNEFSNRWDISLWETK